MNPFHQLYCRIFQSVLRLAIPFLPYRDPKILRTVAEVPAELRQNVPLTKEYIPVHC